MYSFLVTPRRLVPNIGAKLYLPADNLGTWDFKCPEPSKPISEGDLQIMSIIDCGEEVMSCQFNQGGKLLAVGLINGNIKVYKMREGLCVHMLSDVDTVNKGLPVTSLRFFPQNQTSSGDLLLATYASGLVKFWHLSSQTCLHTLTENRQTLTSVFNHSGKRFLTAGSNTAIHVYDTETKHRVSTCQPSPSMTIMNGHRSRVFALAFHPESNEQFISGGWDNTVQFWNTQSQHALWKLSGPHVCGDALQFEPLTHRILTGSWRKHDSLQIWDSKTGKKLHEIPDDYRGHSRIYSCRWMGSGHIMAAGSESNMCRVIDRNKFLTTGCLVDLPGGVYCTDVTEETGNFLIAVSSQSCIYLLEMPKK
ncbi:dynein assembly factor with WDR repeat domains 1-like [Rhinatrema bivittatum]|uniref:dynein assembly factor with WDR repeat domains 1-like n=1 Tax=Rhinatrema bivittatum TaxID=194408 RepID=UPI001129ED65|nr:dynein assembly factor with WDR repeat domains 1-like [Rhinatrema bivittatum]XP_029462937.1 dynein assembly factor with WDR repeat domains 1-like [Rhinatrema bivittatum]